MHDNLTHSAAFSTDIIEFIRGKSGALIVTHDHPDPDALASAYALKHLFLIKTGQEATIAFGGIIGRGENQVMVKELEIKAVCLNQLSLEDYSVICMVDCQPGAGNTSFPPGHPVHIVIDHHPMRSETEACRWVDIRPEYGASATILFEYLHAQEVKIATKLATILFYAIKSETQSLGRDWTRADRAAYLDLLPLCNNRILYQIANPKSPRSYFNYVGTGLHNARVYGDLLVFNLFCVDHPEIVAEIADFLMRVDGVSLVLGMGCYQEEGVLSMRTSSPEINAGQLIQSITAGLGTAGGHGMIAGGQLRPMPREVQEQRQLEETLIKRLHDALHRPLQAPVPLVDSPQD